MTCPHTNLRTLWTSGEDAPGKSLDITQLCDDCGLLRHDYRHNGGQTSSIFPMDFVARGVVRQRALLGEALAALKYWRQDVQKAIGAPGGSSVPFMKAIRRAEEMADAVIREIESTDRCDRCFTCLNDPSRGFDNPVMQQMIVCPECGNKRCPKSTHHAHPCTDSNEPGQPGSRYA